MKRVTTMGMDNQDHVIHEVRTAFIWDTLETTASTDQSLQELGQGCTTEKSWFDSRWKKETFIFSTAFRLALRLLQASYRMDVHSEAEQTRWKNKPLPSIT